MKLQVLGTVLLGGIAALDATPVSQSLLSQPLVTSSLLAFAWGDWGIALKVGIVLQILAASTLPIGARTPEDYAAGGVVGTGLALMLGSDRPLALDRDACALVGVVFGILVAMGGIPLLKWQRRRNEGLSRWCEAELLRGSERALGEAQRAAVVLAFAVGVGYTAVCLGVGLLGLGSVVRQESLRLSHAWSLAQPLWLGLGLAQMLNAFIERRPIRAAVFGIALMTTWVVLRMGEP